MTPNVKSRMIIAIAVNLAVGQVAAAWFGFPRWTGTLVAGGIMAAASRPESIPAAARPIVQLAVMPGNLVAQALEDDPKLASPDNTPEP